MKKNIQLALILGLLACFAVSAAIIGWRMHENSLRDKEYKLDYFILNQIKYGLLSGDNWTFQLNRIILMKVDSFRFDKENKAVLTKQINGILNRLFDEVDEVLHKKQDKLKDRIKYKIINSFVDIDNFRKEIPRFSRAIIQELDKSGNKEKLKGLIKEKITDILAATRQDTLGEQQLILGKYKYKTKESFNKNIMQLTTEIQLQQRRYGYLLIGILLSVLLLWLYIMRHRHLQATSFIFSVLISFIALFIGVSLPMIEIDARIGTLDLKLLSSNITFYDQVIFYQAKSILDVIHILLVNGGADTIFVGFLILLFSVIFPVTKLICTTIYLFLRSRSNAFIRFMAFNSGKWSMADVMVVAIFMAYVGFKSILDNQLEDITVHNETVNVVTTNRTNLQTGFTIFVAFVLFNLALAEILKYITKHEVTAKEISERPVKET
jgi:hypothetical protein